MVRDYHARGKLLLTGEYVVMQGALALACPTRRGQSMYISTHCPGCIHWKALTPRGEVWLEAEWTLNGMEFNATQGFGRQPLDSSGRMPLNLVGVTRKGMESSVVRLEEWITRTLFLSRKANPDRFNEEVDRIEAEGVSVETYLEFERDWGLGSSSSLISLLAQWWGCPAMELHALTQGGSGYDQACATAAGPIHYQLMGEGFQSFPHTGFSTETQSDPKPDTQTDLSPDIQSDLRPSNRPIPQPCLRPCIQSVAFRPIFHEHILFVYTGMKQSTDHSLRKYLSRPQSPEPDVLELSECTRQLTAAADLKEFMEIMHRHEKIISDLLGFEPLQTSLFSRFPGQTKSLGAWGGDFILAATPDPDQAKKFLKSSGYPVHFSFHDLLLCPDFIESTQ
ncbi:MAG: hypothetical protein FJ344_06910 [Sphingomonadales bacterium]|nr:hypothetical protein [Sphingomonadales bacterium]